MKKLIWMGSSKEDLRTFPGQARREMGHQLENVQEGVDPDDWKPMSSVGSGVREIRVRESSGAFRCISRRGRKESMSCFQKKTQKTSRQDLDLAARRFKAIQVKV